MSAGAFGSTPGPSDYSVVSGDQAGCLASAHDRARDAEDLLRAMGDDHVV
jgi:hypothetical protein